MKPLPLATALLMISAPAFAGAPRDNNAGQDNEVAQFRENIATGARVELEDENVARCPKGYSGSRNITNAFVSGISSVAVMASRTPQGGQN